MRLEELGKRAGARVALTAGALGGRRDAAALGVLLLHRVTPGDGVPLNVRPATLRAQLEGLLRDGVVFRPLSQVVRDAARHRLPPPRTAVLTFDDGYSGVATEALPVLQDLQVPATVLVATSWVGSGRPFPFDAWGVAHAGAAAPGAWRPLDWDQCRALEASGLVDVGSHSHTHRSFRGRPQELAADLRTSLEVLAAELGPGPRPFAFPFGSGRGTFANAALLDASRAAGATCALTTTIGTVRAGADPFGWPRLEVSESDTAATLRAKLDGWYDWMESGRDVYRRLRATTRQAAL